MARLKWVGIINENEIPRINFIFNKEAYNLFYEIMKKPFKLETGWTPNIEEKDIEFLKNSINYNYPTIYIKNHINFFTYLTEITNNNLKMHKKYNEYKPSRQYLIYILKRIWLRMGPNDFNNVELFLERQLNFIKSTLFLEYKDFRKNNIVNTFENYKVSANNTLNRTWDEANNCMSFKVLTEDISHTLPGIYYDTSDDTCYIYAIQNNIKDNKNKEINKLIYKKYRGNGQPNKVYALKLFINLLKEKNIKYIKIPTLQVLNYDYHEILSKKAEASFKKEWSQKRLEELKKLSKKEYENMMYYYNIDKIWYNHVVNKKDEISKIKTEDLINLIYRIVNEDNELKIISDLHISDTIKIKILKK